MKIGDRVELVSMTDDPNPIPMGTKGTIDFINPVNMKPAFTQVGVKWDNGRTLMVCIPPDQIRVITS